VHGLHHEAVLNILFFYVWGTSKSCNFPYYSRYYGTIFNRKQDFTTPSFLSGGGEMAKRIRGYDWAPKRLGNAETWRGGGIEAKAKEGEGAEFIITLPLKPQESNNNQDRSRQAGNEIR
jgi:hypothetical protein